jgi:beta-lactamase superfamily II metal-dependent hydrolase
MNKWAAFPAASIFKDPTGRATVGQALWGDFVLLTGPKQNGRFPVRSRRVGWMDEDDLQDERLLEIVFVDIGQGDGILLVTPEDHKMLIDAGEGDNMHRFLRWRFGKFRKRMEFQSVVISHGDMDHWGGFGRIFAQPNLRFGTVYHNGLVERADAAGDQALGPVVPSGAKRFVTGIISTTPEMRRLLDDPAKVGGRRYAGLLRSLLASGRVERFQMLGCSKDQPSHLPGFGPDKPLSIQVLGPVIEKVGDTPALRWLGDVGKTKNGHSVLLRLRYRDISILLGGDLNTPSQDLLLTTHTGLPSPATGPAAAQALISSARNVLQSDFAKACHHGSADFSGTFLAAVNPIATVVSSGDEESFAHPRPDALGAYGRAGRGARPLIFSTELSRSSAERIKFPNRFRAEVFRIVDRIVAAEDDVARSRARTQLQGRLGGLDRSVAVYGAINLRTDGRRAVVAYRIEKPPRPNRKWDLYTFEPGPDGLRYTGREEAGSRGGPG